MTFVRWLGKYDREKNTLGGALVERMTTRHLVVLKLKMENRGFDPRTSALLFNTQISVVA